ncbi:MAG: energy-coupling factor ABC transporter permease [bacterium]
MHIPDGFLDPKVSGSMMGVAAIALSYCIAKVANAITAVVPQEALAVAGRGMGSFISGGKRMLTKIGEQKLYQMGMVASLVFAAQMFNFPIEHGTSGHLLGGILAAVLLGPFAGAIVISVVLAVQMIFFADGGALALGANIVNMAVIGTLGCYYLYYFIKKFAPEWIAIFISAWTSVVLASFICTIQIGLSGTISYGQVIPAMVRVHALIGIAEALITIMLITIYRSLIAEGGGK